MIVDPARATLNNLVEDVLKLQLGYGEEFSINCEAGTLYDPELDDNLSKAFSDLGIKAGSFLTIIDDEEENPRVNLSLSVLEQAIPEDSKPVQVPQKIEVARKPKAATTNGDTNGVHGANGVSGTNGTGIKRKRSRSPEEQQDPKTAKIQKTSNTDDLIVLDDSSNGAIIIDD